MSNISAGDGVLVIHGTIVTMGGNWIPATHYNATAAQYGAIDRQNRNRANACKAWFVNRESYFMAYTVEQEDGSVDVLTVSPNGREAHYTATVDPDGRKRERQIIWAGGQVF